MKFIDKVKIVFIAMFTGLNTLLGTLAIPFYILVGANIVDYMTGIMASAYRGESVNSNRGFRGIAKKVCMWLLVAIGYALDYCIIILGETIGITIGFKCLVSAAVVFWLLFNEFISLLENISDIMGEDNMPPFLMKLCTMLKVKTEEKSNIDEVIEKVK